MLLVEHLYLISNFEDPNFESSVGTYKNYHDRSGVAKGLESWKPGYFEYVLHSDLSKFHIAAGDGTYIDIQKTSIFIKKTI